MIVHNNTLKLGLPRTAKTTIPLSNYSTVHFELRYLILRQVKTPCSSTESRTILCCNIFKLQQWDIDYSLGYGRAKG